MLRRPLAVTLLAAGASLYPLDTAAGDQALIERGRYLVEKVAQCPVCHTPRNEKGELDRDRWLQGGRHGYAPVNEMPEWVTEAPGLAGLPGGYSQERLAAFLTSGRKPNGGTPRPPMKPYRLEAHDARAIAAYLASLEAPPE